MRNTPTSWTFLPNSQSGWTCLHSYVAKVLQRNCKQCNKKMVFSTYHLHNVANLHNKNGFILVHRALSKSQWNDSGKGAMDAWSSCLSQREFISCKQSIARHISPCSMENWPEEENDLMHYIKVSIVPEWRIVFTNPLIQCFCFGDTCYLCDFPWDWRDCHTLLSLVLKISNAMLHVIV